MPSISALTVVHQLHRLEDAERLARRATGSPSSTNGGSPVAGAAVEGADHRALDPDEAVRRRRDRRLVELARPRRRPRRAVDDGRQPRACGARCTRMPSSSTVISSIPVSWTIRTTARMRSSRLCSSPRAPGVSSPPARSRIDWSSRSASAPKSASRSSSSSLEASPFALSRSASRSTVLLVGRLAEQADRPLERRVDRRRACGRSGR